MRNFSLHHNVYEISCCRGVKSCVCEKGLSDIGNHLSHSETHILLKKRSLTPNFIYLFGTLQKLEKEFERLTFFLGKGAFINNSPFPTLFSKVVFIKQRLIVWAITIHWFIHVVADTLFEIAWLQIRGHISYIKLIIWQIYPILKRWFLQVTTI